MKRSNIIIVAVSVAWMMSLIICLNFQIYAQIQNEKVINNMTARALGSYSAQIATAEYFLKMYLDTKNKSLIENGVAGCSYGALLAADVCRQGSSEQMYSELWNTAFALNSYAVYHVGFGGRINETKLTNAVSALDQIWRSFAGIEMVNDANPIEYLTEVNGANATSTVIYYCLIAQANLPQSLNA